MIDASQPGWEEQVEVVESVLEEMGLYDGGAVAPERKRVVYVFNKADLLPDPATFLAQVREHYPHAVLTSANSYRPLPPHTASDRPGLGMEGLRAVLRTSAQALRPVARILVPATEGKVLAAVHRDSEVLREVQVDGVVEVTARVEGRLLGKLRREGVAVEISEGMP